ncbi:asparaginase [Mangrovicella endophytica]|uniref:asparaginase n=1 Tax=Mangrovicella endophytica TaxID=2066697 RepID=UPI000C9E9F2A|nr:asparaginase [Mangrovicella endophytica]
MANPVLVQVTRGSRVESAHRGSVAVVDASGGVLRGDGDVETPVFPRSAVKVFQGIPLIETGAADAFGLSVAELSLACASHSGEPGHVAAAAGVLARAGLGEGALECGCHWPFEQAVALAMAKRGEEPGQLHNNCSGKHAGFLCTAVHQKEETSGYVRFDHPVQLRAQDVMEELTGCRLGEDVRGIDGCSIPTYAAPLRAFAHGFAKLAGGNGADAGRLAAGRRLIEACMAEPWHMAGTHRACVQLMEAAPGRVFAKTGAEGVFCGAVPELGLGFALKMDDGATRASEAAVASVLSAIFKGRDETLAETYADMACRPLRNWQDTQVGAVFAPVN